jgi:hypothetical protein
MCRPIYRGQTFVKTHIIDLFFLAIFFRIFLEKDKEKRNETFTQRNPKPVTPWACRKWSQTWFFSDPNTTVVSY